MYRVLMVSSGQFGERLSKFRRMFMAIGKRSQEPVSQSDQQPEPATWDKDFNTLDPELHLTFLEMAAQSVQEAMNIASRKKDVSDLIKVSDQWGKLAEYHIDIRKPKLGLGFRSNEDG